MAPDHPTAASRAQSQLEGPGSRRVFSFEMRSWKSPWNFVCLPNPQGTPPMHFDDLPRVTLGHLPTPLEPLASLQSTPTGPREFG